MNCCIWQFASTHPWVSQKPTLSTLLHGQSSAKPTSKGAGSFDILQPKAGKESRTQRKSLFLLGFKYLFGGMTYGKSAFEYGIGAKERRRLFAHRRKRKLNNIKIEEVIASETKRLSEKFGKTFLDCEDLIKLTGLGRDNVRLLMRSRRFPVVKVGKRQVVSILNFVAWQMRESAGGDFNGR